MHAAWRTDGDCESSQSCERVDAAGWQPWGICQAPPHPTNWKLLAPLLSSITFLVLSATNQSLALSWQVPRANGVPVIGYQLTIMGKVDEFEAPHRGYRTQDSS